MDDDWDLHAVVRGCTTVTSSSSSFSAAATASSVSSPAIGSSYQSSPPSTFFPASQVLSLSNPFESKGSIGGLHELCKPFFIKSQAPPFSYSPKSPPQMKQKQQQPQQHHLAGSGSGSATTPRSKRRKNQFKKVCQVSAENLSSDIWAWRKYGQKPIKGSPYPRGYYRCSSSKGCLARKQVERNKSEPAMFIVTYTGEHNHPAPTHRNSLAGSTRQKPLTPETATAGDSGGKALTNPVSPETPGAEEDGVAPLSESKEDLEDLMNDDDGEEHEFGVSDMLVTDDFFEGLDELTGSAVVGTTEDCSGDPFVGGGGGGITLPSWVASNAATAAGGS